VSHDGRHPRSWPLPRARVHATGVVHYEGPTGIRLASVMRSRAAVRSSVRSSSSWRRSRTCCSSWPTRVRSAAVDFPQAFPGRDAGMLPAVAAQGLAVVLPVPDLDPVGVDRPPLEGVRPAGPHRLRRQAAGQQQGGIDGLGRGRQHRRRDRPGRQVDDPCQLVLEGRLISVALQVLRLETSVVLDYGLWGRDERSALRWLARSAGASCQVVYLPVDKDVQLARITHRQATTPHQTFPMSEADVNQWREQFQVPDAAELDGGEIPGPPAGWPGWPEWAVDHWPSLTGS
jgi:hypothetical protein